MSGIAAVPDAQAQIAALLFAVLLIDGEDRVVEANPAAEEMLGQSQSRMEGKRFADLVTIGEPGLLANLADRDSQLLGRDIPVETPLGAKRVNISASPLYRSPGWRVLTLSEAGQNAALLADPDSGEIRAPAILAHEIKNPLAAIRGASQLLDRRVSARDKALTELISGEVDRIAGLIDRMQQLGSTEKPGLQACNVHATIRKAIATVRAARGDACRIIEAFDPSLPQVMTDPVTLEQALINLLTNACEACADGEDALVTVATRYVSGSIFNTVRLGKATRVPIEITVADNGPGIDPALRDHVFEPFVTSKPRGQGLGLALVRKMIRDMGGRISHERDERAATTAFRINLARASEEPA